MVRFFLLNVWGSHRRGSGKRKKGGETEAMQSVEGGGGKRGDIQVNNGSNLVRRYGVRVIKYRENFVRACWRGGVLRLLSGMQLYLYCSVRRKLEDLYQ